MKILKLAKKLTDFCDENDIWYTLDKKTLLGAVRHGGFVPWSEKFEIALKVEDYIKLKRLLPRNIIDSSMDSNYKSLIATYVEDNSEWEKEQPFIQIRVAVASKTTSAKRFASGIRMVSNVLTSKSRNIKQAINETYDPKFFEGYLFIESRHQNLVKNWVKVLSGNRKKVNFNSFEFKIFSEYDDYLKVNYGDEYIMAHDIPPYWYEYIAPLKRNKVK